MDRLATAASERLYLIATTLTPGAPAISYHAVGGIGRPFELLGKRQTEAVTK